MRIHWQKNSLFFHSFFVAHKLLYVYKYIYIICTIYLSFCLSFVLFTFALLCFTQMNILFMLRTLIFLLFLYIFSLSLLFHSHLHTHIRNNVIFESFYFQWLNNKTGRFFDCFCSLCLCHIVLLSSFLFSVHFICCLSRWKIKRKKKWKNWKINIKYVI